MLIPESKKLWLLLLQWRRLWACHLLPHLDKRQPWVYVHEEEGRAIPMVPPESGLRRHAADSVVSIALNPLLNLLLGLTGVVMGKPRSRLDLNRD